MKDAIVIWDKNIFDGENKLLPNSNRLFTQIYGTPEKESSWSIILDFEETPRIQGYKSKSKVKFLVEKAPHDILKEGFEFDFLDGTKKIGICKIINSNSININEIQVRLDLIENEKIELRSYVNSLRLEEISYMDEDLIKIVKYSNDYPYLFPLILKLNKTIALEYLKEYFFNIPIESNTVYHSNLPLFLFNLKKVIGEEELKIHMDSFSNEVKNNNIIISALDEIL